MAEDDVIEGFVEVINVSDKGLFHFLQKIPSLGFYDFIK